MNILPEKPLLKRGEVVSSGVGISEGAFDKAVKSEALKRIRPPGCSYALYLRADIMRVFGLIENNK